jgi:hypothetical protein
MFKYVNRLYTKCERSVVEVQYSTISCSGWCLSKNVYLKRGGPVFIGISNVVVQCRYSILQ